jgi:predicted PurR-regulated permease PerM
MAHHGRRLSTMTEPLQNDRFRRGFVLLLVIGVTAAFLWMVWPFVMTVMLAAILAGLFHRLYRGLFVRFGGRGWLAAMLTVIFVLCVIVVPLALVLGLVASEALRLSTAVAPRVEDFVTHPNQLPTLLEKLPFYEHIAPYRAQILARGGELVGNLGRFAVSSISATTASTASAILQFFILLYTLFFLLIDGPQLLRKVTSYLPLREAEKELVLDKFVSVTRATLRGTLVIGIVQGTLGGLSFWAAGIDGALFWGTMMVVLSVLPVVGGALVWVPAVIILAATGNWQSALGLTLFNALIVGSVDNVLRPRLVGRDTEMHDLMILFSTLGGIAAFGPMGFIIGPILAAVFVTSWEIFGTAFGDVIPVGQPIHLTDGHAAEAPPPAVIVTPSEHVPEA